ncbi:MAG: response regulator [Vicinamibacterales bacterium]
MIVFPPDAPDDDSLGEPARLERLCATAHILVIDDEPINVEMVTNLLGRSGYTRVSGMTDARQLEAYILGAPPDLVLLDIHMPERDGFEVMDALAPLIKADRLPVIVVTGDDSADVRRRALTHGARDFLTKPFDLTEIAIRVRNHLETRFLFHHLRTQNRSLRDSVWGRTQELESTRVEMIERLALASEYRDDSTNHHNTRVGRLVSLLAQQLGESQADADIMGRASTLHDVGKIGIPDALLRKPAALTAPETRVMQSHTTIGARILGGSEMPLLRVASSIALTHHERWDGQGYPNGLAGHDIPLAGRIAALADAFDAMTTDRPYRAARPIEFALQSVLAERGRQFDAALVDALLSCDRDALAAVRSHVP